MAIAITCRDVRQIGGKVYVRFSDKTELEFLSLQEVKDYVREFSGNEIRDLLKRIAIAKYLHVDPTGSNPSLLENKVITLDLDMAQNLVRITNG
jgi:hypothetical protein